MKRFLLKAVMVLSLVVPGVCKSSAQTLGIFPGSERKENVVYCIGDELNVVRFTFFREGFGIPGKYPASNLTENSAQQLVISVDIPQTVNWVGAVDAMGTEFLPCGEGEKVEHEGMAYSRYRIVPDRATLIGRMNRNNLQAVGVWIRPPAEINAPIYWKVLDGERIVADASTNLKTLGTIEKDLLIPKKFISYLYYADTHMTLSDGYGDVSKIAGDLIKERAVFYAKIGITHTTGGDAVRHRPLTDVLRDAGIKLVYQFTGRDPEFTPKCYRTKGLVNASDEFCRKILTSEVKQTYARNAVLADGGYLWDFEPHTGPGSYPGYDDLETIKAFCKVNNLAVLTPDEIKRKYAKEYYDYRMKLMGAPVFALRQLVDSIKPGTQIWLCQGSGLPIGSEIDYKTYDSAVDYHQPMLYVPPSEFYQKVKRMSEYVNPRKLVPVTMPVYAYLKVPDKFGSLLLEYISTASLGCAGITLYQEGGYDGQQFYEIYLATRMLASAESFYMEGKLTGDVEVKAMPYIEKKVEVGANILDLSEPNWKKDLVVKTHTDGQRILVTLLNFNDVENAYVMLRLPAAKESLYLVNHSAGICLTVNGKSSINPDDWRKGVMVKADAFRPALWLITGKSEDIVGMNALAAEDLGREFNEKKAAAVLKGTTSVPIGVKGKMAIQYAEVKDPDNGNQLCLEVSTPLQTVCFTPSGGRIWKWVVGGKDIIYRSLEAGGAGMDQIYLPESGRGTGENRADMSLTKAVNSGEEIQLTYLGKLNNGSLAVEKTYRIPANANRVMVHLKLTNVDLVNPQSVGISYRSHSMLSGGLVRAEEDDARVFMVATQGDIVTVPSFPSGPTDTAFSNVVHGEQYRNLLWTSALKGTARNVCGEYLPKLQLGVVFQLPSDFLQIYRWQGKNMGTVEWMTKVAELASGKSTEFSYEMEICTAASPEEFKNKLTQIQPAPHFDQKAGMPSANMLPFDMRKDDGTGLPKGFLVTDLKKNGKVTFDNEVTAGTSGPSVRVDLPEDGTVRVDTADAISLKTNTLYLFSVQIKAQKVSPGGAAMNAGGCYERGVFAYVHSATKAEYACSIIVGKGDTDGWVTLMLPFDTGKFPAFEKVRFLLRCIGISGTVWFQNPALVEMPDGFEIKPHFILSNGEIVPSTLLVLQ